MTSFEDATIADSPRKAGLAVETVAGYGPDDDRTVFVACRSVRGGTAGPE